MESATNSLSRGSSTTSSTTISFCSLCDKPFTNEYSRHRHVRYCSTRTRNRPRSCRACNAAKVKCSFEIPCLRCTKKSIECSYDGAGTATKKTLPKSLGRRVAQEPSTRHSTSTASLIDEMLCADDEFLPDPEVTFTDHLDTNGGPFNNPASALLNVQASSLYDPLALNELFSFEDHALDHIQPLSNDSVVSWNKSDKEVWPSWCGWARQGFSLSSVTETPMVEMDPNLVAIMQTERPLAHYSADVVIQTLRSFPSMMLRRETFPWFIHPQSQLIFKPARDALPEALSNCMSIAQMFALRTSETKRFLWSTIRRECRHLVNEKYHLSGLEIFVALQALIIYLIMCIVDQSPEGEETSLELLTALHELYLVGQSHAGVSDGRCEMSGARLKWDDWIFAESERRFKSLWFLIGCVVCVKTGTISDPSQCYRDLPLPSPKSLWEAPTQFEWEQEYEACRIFQTSGFVTLGDLMDAQKSEFSPANAQKLDKWNAGVDNLGFLLNSARTMI